MQLDTYGEPDNRVVSISGSNMERHQSKEDEMEGRKERIKPEWRTETMRNKESKTWRKQHGNTHISTRI